MPSTTPTGIKNNNYLNVKNTSDPWMDAGGKRSKTDSRGHAVFTDPAYGVRAGILQLRAYFLTHKLRTIIDILSRWAPTSDTVGSIAGNDANDPTGYALFVAKRMGIAHNKKLELFNDDKTIDNVGQLRGLFFAMAAFEIGGGFKVPDKDFNTGLEVIEPGITKTGTGPALPSVSKAAAATPKGWKISASVGSAERGASNEKDDVETVQSMLRSAAMILGTPAVDPGAINGIIEPKAKDSATVRAIIAFQSRFLTKSDGIIDVGGRTWRELLAVVSGSGDAQTPSGREFFPFATLPSASWTSAPRSFAANRKGNRAHAACDLYFPAGTTIHAIADGIVVRGPSYFYQGTYALEVDHGTFIARYGEIQQSAHVREGDRITAGQPIARVGHLEGIQVPSDMLHLELYDKTAHGSLTTSAEAGKKAPNGRPFMRRKDLIDPTPFLNRWKDNLPGQHAPADATRGILSNLFSKKTPAEITAASVKIPAKGFCILIQRIREEKRSPDFSFARTVSDYQCYWNGEAVHDLGGQIVERNGPSDNTSTGISGHRRIEAGQYRLSIHAGESYKTYNYAKEGSPLPGLLLMDTGKRSWILIHPCHHDHGYISSIGCLNPAAGLKDASSRINLKDSRARVIAMIEGMKAKMGGAFPKEGAIPGATVLITGEPS